MKQVLRDLRSGETVVVDVPVPNPGPGTARVRTATSVVSIGTERMLLSFAEKSLLGKARARPDLVRQMVDKARREGLLTTAEAALRRLDQPIPLGYSSAGTIDALGEGMQGYRVGQRVACAGGGYAVHAEYAVVPQNLLAPLPESVDFESGAFATLGAIAMHGFRLAELGLGARVAVIGLGLLGQLTVMIARAAGCHVLGVDLDPERVERARRIADDAVVRKMAPEAAQAFSRGRGCDAVLICADTPSGDPVELAGEIARDRARVVAIGAVGMDIPRKLYYDKELTFLVSRSYGPGRYDHDYEERGQDYPIGYVRWTEGRNLEAFVDLLAAGRIDVKPLVTHRYPVDQAAKAYALIADPGKEPHIGVLLTYPESPNAGLEPEGTRVLAPEHLPVQGALRRPTQLGVGVLGAGNFARAVLLPALKRIPVLNLVGIASAAGLNAQAAAQKYGFRYASSDPEQIITDPDVDVVAILTRHHLHAAQVSAAFQAGKHVFCEKPLAITSDGLAEVSAALEEVVSSTGGWPILMVGFNRRFAPLAQHLADFLAERQEPLVAHYRVNAGYLPPEHWLHDPEQGGGRIIGEACHFIDFITFLVGDPPAAVSAHALPDLGRYQRDNVVLNLEFPDGSIGTVTYLANGDRAFPKERLEVFAGGRVGVLDDFRSLTTVHDGRQGTRRARLRQDKGHHAEWQAFTAAVLAGGPPPIPLAHILGVARSTFAAVAALNRGQRVQVDK